MKNAIISVLLCIPVGLLSQIQIDRQVISPFGINGVGTYQISSTAGQIDYSTGQTEDYFLTQGFQQPSDLKREFSFEIITPECDNGMPVLLDINMDSLCTGGIGEIFLDEILQGDLIELESGGSYELEINCESGSNYFETLDIPEIILQPCDLVFYNVITPSNELFYWHIDNIETSMFVENHVSIYNRWGAQVWEGDNYDNSSVFWDGNDNGGDALPQGTYYYIVEIGDENYTGYIELIK